MITYRLSRFKFQKDLSGNGAKDSGGRWNSIGTRMVYTSQSIALCTVEVAVHIPLNVIPLDYTIVTIEIPDSVDSSEIKPAMLSDNWRSELGIKLTQRIGDKFIFDSANLVMRVPSAVIQGDYNILINPNHKDFSKVKIVDIKPYAFDPRLFIRLPISEA